MFLLSLSYPETDLPRLVKIFYNTSLFLQSLPGLEQYAVKKFAESLEMVPKTLAKNAGIKVTALEFYFWFCDVFLCLERSQF